MYVSSPLPTDDNNRVKLMVPSEDGTDYINASYVDVSEWNVWAMSCVLCDVCCVIHTYIIVPRIDVCCVCCVLCVCCVCCVCAVCAVCELCVVCCV